MSMKLLAILKAILPTKRIAAWILGVIGAALALFMGVNNSDLKEQFCANAPVDLPKVEVVQPLPDSAPSPDEKK